MFMSPMLDQGYYLMTPGSVQQSYPVSGLHGTEIYEWGGSRELTICVDFKRECPLHGVAKRSLGWTGMLVQFSCKCG